MARTAPAPNIPPIPGMCPSIAVLAGGGDAGSGSGKDAKDGKGDDHAATSKGGENAEADKRGAPDVKKYPECGYASHPVDVVTGRAFTHPITDLALPGPLPLSFQRMYSSKMAGRDAGLGFGWAHTFGWEVEVRRRRITVWNEQGIGVDFPEIAVGSEIVGPWGWLLRREAWGFAVDADDGLWHLFSAAENEGKRFRLTAIEDRNRNRIALTYEDGRLVEVVDSAGRVIRLKPTREGRIGSVLVQNAVSQGQWVAFATYTHDERGDLAAVTDADGFTARYAYDEDHRLTSDTDRAGMCFHFVYDGEGRCVESWGDYPGKVDPSLARELPRLLSDGKTRVKGISHCKLVYGADGYSEVFDSMRVRRFFGNARGTLDKRVEGAGVVTCSYDDQGHLLARTDEMRATTLFERDPRGRLTRLVDPLGRTTIIELSPHALPARVIDPTGAVTEYTRDRFGNVEQRVAPGERVTAYRHDARGLVTQITEPDGRVTRFEHDAQGSITAAHGADGETTRFTHDALGRVTSVSDPLGATTRYAYSERGDLLASYDALGGATRFTYDGEGKLTGVIHPSGQRRTLAWGGYEKLCEVRDEAGGVTRLTYDLDGFPVELVSPAGEVWRYEHGPTGRLVSEVAFDGARTSYRYDLCGRIIAITDGKGDKTEFVRDAAGYVVERRYPDDLVEELEYDARGDLVRAATKATEVRMERDAAGQVARQTLVVGGEEYSVFRGREGHRAVFATSHGHVVSAEPGADGRTWRYLLGGAHEVLSVRDGRGREVERRLGGGAAIQSVYDTVGRLSERRVATAVANHGARPGEPDWLGERATGITAHKRFRYDADGHLGEGWDRDHGGTEYRLDPVGRLLAVLREGTAVESYAYDAGGNITRTRAGGASYTTGDRLLTLGDATYTHDALGQLVEKRTRDAATGDEKAWAYTWNGAGRLTSATASDGIRVDFLYDALGRRVQKRVARTRAGAAAAPISLTTFIWDGSAVAQEIKKTARAGGDPVIEERSYWIAGEGYGALAHRDVRRDESGEVDSGWVHYVSDPNGTPERLVDARGQVVCELERTALGRTRARPGARADTQLRFMGQYEDAETGLHYNHFRYYDPDTGRFLSPDPIGLHGGLNRFRYVDDPNTMIDPLGLTPCHCVLITNNGPPSRAVTTADGGTVYAWRRNSGGALANVPADVQAHIPAQPAAGSGTPVAQRGRCAEPAAITDYRAWLDTQPNPGNANMDARVQAGVVGVVPMEQRGDNKGAHKPPCGFCGPTLTSMGIADRVMTPDQAVASTGVPRDVVQVQGVPMPRW